jgi:hypothetical protein
MAFERFHPDRDLQRNLARAHDRRAAYLRSLVRRVMRVRNWAALWRHVRAPRSAAEDLAHGSAVETAGRDRRRPRVPARPPQRVMENIALSPPPLAVSVPILSVSTARSMNARSFG